MGGIGIGRYWHYGVKSTTDEYRSIDIRIWHREGILTPGQAFRWEWLRNGKAVASIFVETEPGRVILDYRHKTRSGEWADKHYSISLDWTECNYGGERPWFLCPANGCSRRVAILYGGGVFACRHCRDLAYPSQRETPDQRAARRANQIRARLGRQPGIKNLKGWMKPKGMHWSTFTKLNKEHDACVAKTLVGMANQLKILQSHVDKESR